MAHRDLSETQKAILELLNEGHEESPEGVTTERNLLRTLRTQGLSRVTLERGESGNVVHNPGKEELNALSRARYITKSSRFGEPAWQITPAGQGILER